MIKSLSISLLTLTLLLGTTISSACAMPEQSLVHQTSRTTLSTSENSLTIPLRYAAASNFSFTRLKSSWSDKWNQWDINGQGSLKADWSDKVNAWSYSLPGGGKGDIDADWSGKLNAWTLKANGKTIRIKADGSDKWNTWTVTGPSGELRVKANWSDKWNDWTITGKGGDMRVKAAWSDKWNDWNITDKLPDTDPDLKMAAVFACLIASYDATHS